MAYNYGGGYGGPPGNYGGYQGPPGNYGGYQGPPGNFEGPPQPGYGQEGGYGRGEFGPRGNFGGPQGFEGQGYGGPQGYMDVPPQQQGYGGQQPGYGPQGGIHGMHGPDGQLQTAGRKKALICACNYAGSDCALGGCINDAHCMAYLLTTKFGFHQDNMRMLLDDNPDLRMQPTRQNMLEGFQWLVAGCQPGDSLFFHYSGHGSQQRDPTGDEDDGMNETLCPTDFKRAGQLIDDEINQMLINPIPQGVRLHVVIDACHSGSVCDLEYKASVKGGHPSWTQEYRQRPRIYKGTGGGRAFQFGAATDDQTAADTNKLSGNVSTGAATFSFIQAIEQAGTSISYGTLLHQMHRSLKTLNSGGGGGGGGMASMLGGGGGGGLSSLLGGGGGGGGMSSLMSIGAKLMSSRGTGGGPGLSSLLGDIMQSSNSGGWKKQTPVLSSNEAFDFNMPLQL